MWDVVSKEAGAMRSILNFVPLFCRCFRARRTEEGSVTLRRLSGERYEGPYDKHTIKLSKLTQQLKNMTTARDRV
jgi:hypothetical protein